MNVFRNLTPAEVRYYGAYGVLSEMNLFDINEDAIYWLRWRREDGIKNRRGIFGVNWTSPRASCYWGKWSPVLLYSSGMTALDFSRLG